MTDLREKVASVIRDAMWKRSIVADDVADQILAIPEIRDALALIPVNRKVIGGRDE